MTESTGNVPACHCARRQLYRRQQRKKEQCKRKRQTFVFNPEEEVWHEPYMRDLRKEFSEVSVICDSKIELPWKDIALPAAGMKIRQDASWNPLNDRKVDVVEEDPGFRATRKESSGTMTLPWQDLLVTGTVQSRQADIEACDSTLEIPWSDLALERPMEIRPPPEGEACAIDDVEIPWDDILIPQHIVIQSQKKKKHPSSKHPPRTLAGMPCTGCKVCCAKVGSRMRPATSCN